MYITLAILLLLGIYGVYAYQHMAPLLKKGKSLSKTAVAFQTSGKDIVDMLVVGDSTAVGVGSVPQQSVPARVAQELNLSVENHAKSGATLQDVRMQLQQASQEHYELILIQAGANDVMSLARYTTVSEEARLVLEEALRLSERVVFLTAGDIGQAPIWPFPLNVMLSHRTTQVRNQIQPLAESLGVLYVDLYALPDPFGTDPTRYYAPDFLHLSADGYAVWATHVLNAVRNRWAHTYGQR